MTTETGACTGTSRHSSGPRGSSRGPSTDDVEPWLRRYPASAPIDADGRIAIALFTVVLVTYTYFFGGGGWNQNAQLDLTRALVERQTVWVDGYHRNTGDLSPGRNGHIYINKPPGVSLLGAVPYAILYSIERALHIPADHGLVATLNAWLVTAATCGLTGALIAPVLYLHLRRRMRILPPDALGVAAAIAFGTIVFPYSTMLFAHVPSAFFLLLAFVWRESRPLLAGAAAGVAGMSFYFCIPAAAIIVAMTALDSRRKALFFVVGGLPFGLMLAVYHAICFGAPWRTAVGASSSFTDPHLFLGVFRAPQLATLWAILFSTFRGLFYSSPILSFALVGAVVMMRRRVFLRDLAGIVTICSVFVLGTASFNGWHGGSAWGPRYLLTIVPLLAIPMAPAFSALRAPAIALGVLAVAMNLLATAVDPIPSWGIHDPLRQYLGPAFVEGRLSADIADKLRLSDSFVGHVGINRLTTEEILRHSVYAPGSLEAEWAAFNLGEIIFGVGSRASLIPVVMWLVAGGVLLLRRAMQIR